MSLLFGAESFPALTAIRQTRR